MTRVPRCCYYQVHLYIYNNNIELWIYAVYLIIENEKIEKKTFTTYIYNKPPNWELLKKKETTFGINFYHTWFYFIFLRNCDHFYFMDGDDEALIMRDEEERRRKKIKLHVCKKEITIFTTFFTFWIKLTRLLGQRKNLSNDLYLFLLLTCLLLMCWWLFSRKKNLSKIK